VAQLKGGRLLLPPFLLFIAFLAILPSTVWGWEIINVDPSADPRSISVAVDSNNKVHIGYYNYSSNSLRYVNNTSGNWVTTTIATSLGLDYSSPVDIAIDADNKIHISYYKSAPNYDLYYATNRNVSPGSGAGCANADWKCELVDRGYPNCLDLPECKVGGGNSIAVGSDNIVHISYLDESDNCLKYASISAGSWSPVQVSCINASGQYFAGTSIHLDSSNLPHVACTSPYGNHFYKNINGVWNVEYGYMGINASLDILNDKLYISYYRDNHLMYITNESGAWSSGTFAIEGPAYYTSPGRSNSIAMDLGGKAHVSYSYSFFVPGQDNLSDVDLKYATNKNVIPGTGNCGQSNWSCQTIDDGYMTGGLSSIAVDANDNLHIIYNGGGLKYATDSPYYWDFDGDLINNDGDNSGVAGDNLCTGGNTVNCDDNCLDDYNPGQLDYNLNGIGDACEPLSWTDNPIQANVTTIKAAHIIELRNAINNLRDRNGINPFSWTDLTLTQQSSFIKAVHINELRNAIEAVIGFRTWTDGTLQAGVTSVKAVHINELRLAVESVW